MVPNQSIVFMCISGIISVAAPLILFFICKRKFQIRFLPALAGISGFITFAMILESILHAMVLRPAADGSIQLIEDHPILYVFYASFSAGIFEETGRLAFYSFLAKKHTGIKTGLSYGIGHGGTEAILLTGLTMLSNVIISYTINTDASGLLNAVPQLDVVIDTLISTPSYFYLISIVERLFVLPLQIALSVVMWYAVTQKGKFWLYPLSILIHAIVDIPAALYQLGILKSILVIELTIAISAVAVSIFAKKLYNKYEPLSEKMPLPSIE